MPDAVYDTLRLTLEQTPANFVIYKLLPPKRMQIIAQL